MCYHFLPVTPIVVHASYRQCHTENRLSSTMLSSSNISYGLGASAFRSPKSMVLRVDDPVAEYCESDS